MDRWKYVCDGGQKLVASPQEDGQITDIEVNVVSTLMSHLAKKESQKKRLHKVSGCTKWHDSDYFN